MSALNSAQWPSQLKQVKPPVKQLYYSGNYQSKCFERSLAVVGSRKMTRYGEQVINRLIPALAAADVTIISGFMYGVDQASHKACLEAGGRTVAVLGWGMDFPVAHAEYKLFKQIKEKGLILSEYPAQTKPQLWMFPARNRIMAALAKAVLIVEAAPKSGSLITARYALKYGKKLLAVPGPITSQVSAGTNELIKSGQAQMVLSANDISRALGISVAHPECSGRLGSSNSIIKLLSNEALTLDELKQKLNWPIAKVSTELSMLELQGQINEINDRYYLNQNNAS